MSRAALSKVAVWAAALALAVGLFPTLRAMINGGSQPAVSVDTSSAAKEIAAATAARRGAPAHAERVMVVGNSVAFLLARGFRQVVRSNGPVAVFNAAVVGCVFPPRILRAPEVVNGHLIDLSPCHPSWESDAEKAFQPDVVFWIMSTRGWVGGTYQGRPITGCSPTFSALYEHDLRQEIDRLRSGGAKVVVTTSAYSRRVGATNDPKEDDCENGLRRKAAASSGAQLVDLFGFVCPARQCLTKMDGAVLRPDGLHYDGPGATIVAQWLMDQVSH